MADISKEDLRKEIAAILKDADLTTTSTKKVRQELEEKLDANLTSRKKEIDDLVKEFLSSKDSKKGKGKKGDSEEDDEEEEEEEEEEEDSETDKKPKKRASSGKKPAPKKKKGSDDEEEDASEPSEEDSEEGYSTAKKSKPIKTRKLPPKKKKAGSESDSDEDWNKTKKKSGGGGGGKKGGAKKAGSGYTKSLKLTPELAALVGQDSMARHEVVKKVWSIIKEKNLYDPKNRQYAVCDDALMKVIGVKRFRTFGMMRYLKNHFISS